MEVMSIATSRTCGRVSARPRLRLDDTTTQRPHYSWILCMSAPGSRVSMSLRTRDEERRKEA